MRHEFLDEKGAVISMKKLRLDELLLEKNLAQSKDQAARLIMAGKVLVNDTPETKPGTSVALDARVRLKNPPQLYVSRAGFKLAAALEHFSIQVQGMAALDLGASTGGFTDCLLQNGVSHVYAVDVGYGQLAEKLRTDKRVTVFDRTHVKDLNDSMLHDKLPLVVIDLSFIRTASVLPLLRSFLADDAQIIVLVKPQFELPAEIIPAGGIVSEQSDQLAAIASVERAGEALGWESVGWIPSPLTGAKGNQEYLLCFRGKKS